MYTLSFLAVGSFFLCIFITAICRWGSLRLGLVDRPDQNRRIHTQPIPRTGGVAIALAYVAPFGLLLALGTEAGSIFEEHLPAILRLAPAGILIFLVGLLDDVFTIKPWTKLSGQLAAAVLAYSMGIRITTINSTDLVGWISAAVTILWIVACTNAFNLIDGMDGLASGLGLFAAGTMFAAAMLNDNMALALATAPLVGCLLAFLIFNFNPASIFLGDCGSLLVGFLLGCYAIVWTQKTTTILGFAAPLMCVAIPLIDTALSILRRFLRNRPIFSADRGHIHHMLLSRGLTPRRAAVVLYGVAAVGTVLSILADAANDWFTGLLVIFFCTCIFVGIRLLNYVELQTLQQLIVRGTFRRMLDSHISLKSFERELARAETVAECCDIIRSGAREFGFVQVSAAIRGERIDERFRVASGESAWNLRVPLSGDDYIEFKHDHHYMSLAMIGPFVDIVCRQMQVKQTARPVVAVQSAGSPIGVVDVETIGI